MTQDSSSAVVFDNTSSAEEITAGGYSGFTDDSVGKALYYRRRIVSVDGKEIPDKKMITWLLLGEKYYTKYNMCVGTNENKYKINDSLRVYQSGQFTYGTSSDENDKQYKDVSSGILGEDGYELFFVADPLTWTYQMQVLLGAGNGSYALDDGNFPNSGGSVLHTSLTTDSTLYSTYIKQENKNIQVTSNTITFTWGSLGKFNANGVSKEKYTLINQSYTSKIKLHPHMMF